ncbi:MAG: type II toxin-antitoxin system prevent-host-death family antitoxin [Verrucomicrobia bacterium]|nr:type II toxin-antitoxin system prevent-host-death family antitoxin [Verrucomicrobiota bacterium]
MKPIYTCVKTIGIFEVKTRLSEICEAVAETQEPVTVTRRGKPLVRIDPIETDVMSVRERRARYDATYGQTETSDDIDDVTAPIERQRDLGASGGYVLVLPEGAGDAASDGGRRRQTEAQCAPAKYRRARVHRFLEHYGRAMVGLRRNLARHGPQR